MAVLIKLALMASGAILIALGVVIAPLPGPFGVPVMLFGLAVLLRSSVWAKRQFVRLRARHPKLLGPVRSLMRPGAKVMAVLWLQALRLERGVLPIPARRLLQMRRGVKGLCRRPQSRSA